MASHSDLAARWRRLVAITVVAAITLDGPAVATEYQFTRIVDSTMLPPGSLSLMPDPINRYAYDLNNAGTVVFHTTFANQGGDTIHPKIYTSNGAFLHLVDETVFGPSSERILHNQGASINDAGVVAYYRKDSVPNTFTESIRRSDGVAAYTATYTNVSGYDAVPPLSDRAAINNTGAVAFFTGNGGTSASNAAILKESTGTLTTIATLNDEHGFSSFAGLLSLNDQGTVAFSAYASGGSPSTYNIYASDGMGPLTPIHIGTEFLLGSFDADGSNSGSVALATLGGTLYLSDGSSPAEPFPLTPLPGEVYPPWAQTPSVNELDEIAYLAFGNVGHFIAIGSDPALGKVIGEGDLLDGSTVASGGGRLGAPELNDRGQVAFGAMLADGRIGLYVATPLPPGDFTGDLVVDGTDLDVWRDNFGRVDAGFRDGDADEDGDVDGADFLQWQRQTGGSVISTSSAVVPEPAAGFMIAVALAAFAARRKSLNSGPTLSCVV